MAEGLLTMFGKAYDTVGSADKNLVLLTRGDLKIRWGNKYIDLIKNGKINVDVDLIKKVDSKDAIFKNGIYLIEGEETNEVWLYVDGTLINLIGEIGTTYVSYVGQQDVDAEGRFRALSNIGFYYNTLQEALEAKLELGLIFNLADNKLYYIKDGQLILYEQNTSVPNPLVLGSITIDGDKSSIYSVSNLYMGVGTANNITLSLDKTEIGTELVTHQSIESYDYVGSQKGYIITTNENDETVLEIDIVKIRKNLEYNNQYRLTYDLLKEVVKRNGLVKGKEYVITDFQNEWEITSKSETYLDNKNNHVPNVHPIVITAKGANSFEEKGYFEGYDKWIIDYDINFNHYIKSVLTVDENNNTVEVELFTKGRITKLVDEFGNEANYDFKHKTYLHTSSSDDTNQWFFTFNKVNPNYDASSSRKTWENLHINMDATQEKNSEIRNNVIYIKEPELEFYRNDDDGNAILKIILLEDYIIFSNCSTHIPHDNQILDSRGKFVITNEFYGNTFIGLYNDILEVVEFQLNFHNNTFKKVLNCVLDAPMSNNTFDYNLVNVAFKCNTMNNNHITGIIYTNDSRSSYPIEATDFSNNTINNIIMSSITCYGCNIANNYIHDIKGCYINNTYLVDNTIKDIIGDNEYTNSINDDISDDDSTGGNTPGGDTPGGNDNPIVNDGSVEMYGITWYETQPSSPGTGYALYNITYNGTMYYAWLPDTVIVNGTTYYRTQPESPGNDYTLNTITKYGISYYAWIYNDPSCNGCSVSMSRFVSGAQGYGGPAPGTGLPGDLTIGQFSPATGCNDFPTFTIEKATSEPVSDEVLALIRAAWAGISFSFDNTRNTDEEGHSRTEQYYVVVNSIPSNPTNQAIHFYFVPSCNSSDHISFNLAAGSGQNIPTNDTTLNAFISNITGSKIDTVLKNVISNTATPETYGYLLQGFNYVSGKSDATKSWMLANMLAELTPYNVTTSDTYKTKTEVAGDTATNYFVNAANSYGGLKLDYFTGSNETIYEDRILGSAEYAKFKHAYYSTSNAKADSARAELRTINLALLSQAVLRTDSSNSSSVDNDTMANPYFSRDEATHVLRIIPNDYPSNSYGSGDWTHTLNMITQYPNVANLATVHNYLALLDKETADEYFCKILDLDYSSGSKYVRYIYKVNDIGDAAGNQAKACFARPRPGTQNNINTAAGTTTFTIPPGGKMYLCDCSVELSDLSPSDYAWADCSTTNNGETYCQKDERQFTDNTANSTLGSHENPYKSYSSGHSSRAWMNLLVLVEAMGDTMNKDGYTSRIQRIKDYCLNRTVVRAHWKSDTIAGRLAASMLIGLLNGYSELRQEIARL